MTVAARLRALEKAAAAGAARRLDWTLEQLVARSRGEESGPPAKQLRPGERSLEELILADEQAHKGATEAVPERPAGIPAS
jgi:hypothetical protein